MKLPFGLELKKNEVRKYRNAFEESVYSQRPSLDFISTYGSSSGLFIPRYPRPLSDLYDASRYSDTMQIVLGALKSEIFRNGYEVTEKYAVKCANNECLTEFEYEIEDGICPECEGKFLTRPHKPDKKVLEDFSKKVNYNNQTLMELSKEIENDLNIVDDAYVLAVTEYLTGEDGKIQDKVVKEFIRMSPLFMQMLTDKEGRMGYNENGQQILICPLHRERPHLDGNTTNCPECDSEMLPAYYRYAFQTGGLGGVASDSGAKYYLDSEIFHTSKYNPSLLYGFPPTLSIWMKIHTLMGQDKYLMDTYTKQRAPKGMLVFATRAADAISKSWQEFLARVKLNPNYVHPMAIETEAGGKSFAQYIDFMKSLDEMQYSEQRTEFRNQIGALYGVQPIFQGDNSTGGGLNNEGLQITVTNRAVERGQKIYNDKFFMWVAHRLEVDDWCIKLLPSEERDEMSDLQLEQQKITNAQLMLSMGYDVELKPDGMFEFSGEAEQQELMGFGNFPAEDETEDADSFQGTPFSKELKKSFYDDIVKARIPKARKLQIKEERKLGKALEKELNKIKDALKKHKRLPSKKKMKEALMPMLGRLALNLKKTADSVFKKVYKSTIGEVEKELGIDIGYGSVDQNAVEVLSNQKVLTRAYTGLSKNMSKKINKTITEAYKQPNLSLTKLTQKLEEDLKIGESKLETIVRTETQNISNHARELSYKKADPKGEFKYKWIGPSDKRTTKYCDEITNKTKNGVKLVELKQIIKESSDQNTYMASRPFTPHINCRHVHLRKVS